MRPSAIDDAAPVMINAMKLLTDQQTGSHTLNWVDLGVLFGAMMGMISSLLVFQLGQARVWFSMSRDGLLPRLFGRVHPRFRTPATATWIAGFLVGIPAGFLDIGTLSDLSNTSVHALRLRAGFLIGGNHLCTLSRSRTASRLSRPRRHRGAGAQRVFLRSAYVWSAHSYLAAILCLAGYRAEHLLPL